MFSFALIPYIYTHAHYLKYVLVSQLAQEDSFGQCSYRSVLRRSLVLTPFLL